MRFRRVGPFLFKRSLTALGPSRQPPPPLSPHGPRLFPTWTPRWKLAAALALFLVLEEVLHIWRFRVPRPGISLDPPFHVGCQEPILNGSTRANATMVMLARNSDLADAIDSVRNVQRQFNRHFDYPWVFLNDKPWSDEFIAGVRDVVAEGGGNPETTFETIPAYMWGYPGWIDQKRARESMLKMERRGILYGGKESYHHMCRFNSG